MNIVPARADSLRAPRPTLSRAFPIVMLGGALDGGRALPPGVYRVRVRAGGREALGTAVVVP